MENELTWRITSAEKRERTRKLLLRIWLPLILFGIISVTIAYPLLFTRDLLVKGWSFILEQVLYAGGAIVVGLFVVLIMSRFMPHAERTYILDEEGFAVSKGTKKKRYTWDEFEYFYPYSQRYRSSSSGFRPGESKRQSLFVAEDEVMGQIFYLKKKPKNMLGKLYQKFVVVYSEPDNTNAVARFLQRHLPKKQMKATSDSGLVFYEFK